MVAGISGGLFAGFQGFISPESFNLFESIIVLCMIVLGGMGNIPGVILGAVLLTVFPEALRYLGELQHYLFGRVLVDPSDILLMEDLANRWNGWFAIHISSFQESIRAREEVSFLQSREFPVFIVFLDLGAKGKWYRVYAGPFETREEAREVKKNLDAIPQVRFTRVTQIPE